MDWQPFWIKTYVNLNIICDWPARAHRTCKLSSHLHTCQWCSAVMWCFVSAIEGKSFCPAAKKVSLIFNTIHRTIHLILPDMLYFKCNLFSLSSSEIFLVLKLFDTLLFWETKAVCISVIIFATITSKNLPLLSVKLHFNFLIYLLTLHKMCMRLKWLICMDTCGIRCYISMNDKSTLVLPPYFWYKAVALYYFWVNLTEQFFICAHSHKPASIFITWQIWVL